MRRNKFGWTNIHVLICLFARIQTVGGVDLMSDARIMVLIIFDVFREVLLLSFVYADIIILRCVVKS